MKVHTVFVSWSGSKARTRLIRTELLVISFQTKEPSTVHLAKLTSLLALALAAVPCS